MVNLTEWQDFEAEVEEFIAEQVRTLGNVQVQDVRELEPEDWQTLYSVSSESDVGALFTMHISRQVSIILAAMDYDVRLESSFGELAVGFPDYVWVPMGTSRGVICVDVKAPWDLENGTNIISQASSGKPEDENVRQAVEQIYTYMVVSGFFLRHLNSVSCQVMLLLLDKPTQVWCSDDL